MAGLLLMLAGGVLAVCAVGGLVLTHPVRPTTWRRGGAARRLVAARHELVAALGASTAAVVVLLAGVAATVIVCWPLGRLAGGLERSVDLPVFRWGARHHYHGWIRVNELLTLMGNRPQVKAVCLVSAVVLALLWRRRGWWVPPVVIASAFGFEKYGQKLLALVVHRGHPPTTRGTYPSGGVARLVAIYGVILFLVLFTYPGVGRRWRVALWTMFGIAAFVEGYTRIYLLKHWFTDVVGGWVYGSLLLATLIAAASTLVQRNREEGPTAGSAWRGRR